MCNRIIAGLFLLFGISVINAQDMDSNSKFYSNETITVAKGTVLSIQTNFIFLEKDITGAGQLHIGKSKHVQIQIKDKLTIATVKVEDTDMYLYSELAVVGELRLANASIKLNDWNLITEKNIIFENENSEIIENGNGIWIKPTVFEHNLLSHQKDKDQQQYSIAILLEEKKEKATIFLAIQKNTISEKVSFYGNIDKPPPRLDSLVG